MSKRKIEGFLVSVDDISKSDSSNDKKDFPD